MTVTVTRHGRRVGVFIPTNGDRAEAIAAYQAAADKLHALMAEQGIDEDEVVAEFAGRLVQEMVASELS